MNISFTFSMSHLETPNVASPYPYFLKQMVWNLWCSIDKNWSATTLTFLAEFWALILSPNTIALSVAHFSDIDALLAVSEAVKLSLGIAGARLLGTTLLVGAINTIVHLVTGEVPSNTLTVCTFKLSWFTCVGSNLQDKMKVYYMKKIQKSSGFCELILPPGSNLPAEPGACWL